MTPRRPAKPAPKARELEVPAHWLAEDRATLVGQRCGVVSTLLRVEADGATVYSVQLGRGR